MFPEKPTATPASLPGSEQRKPSLWERLKTGLTDEPEALAAPETPAVEALRVAELKKGMTPAPAVEVGEDLIVLRSVEKRFHAFSRCRAASSPNKLAQVPQGALERSVSVREFRDAIARLEVNSVLPVVEGGEQVVMYVARPNREEDFAEYIVPDCQEEGMEKRQILKDVFGKPMVVVFGPKKETQATATASAPEEIAPPAAPQPDAPVVPAETEPVAPVSIAPPAEDETPDWLRELEALKQKEGAGPGALMPEAPGPIDAGKTGTVQGDVKKGMGQFTGGLAESIEPKAQEYADRIVAGEDASRMGVPPPMRERVQEIVEQRRRETEAPVAPVPAAPTAGGELPEWLKSLRGDVEPSSGTPVPDNDLPEWLKGPRRLAEEPPAPAAPLPGADLPPVMAETEEERLARMDKQVQIDGKLNIRLNGNPYFVNRSQLPLENIISFLMVKRGLPAAERGANESTDENLDYAIAKLEVMRTAKEAEAAAVAKVAEPLEPAATAETTGAPTAGAPTATTEGAGTADKKDKTELKAAKIAPGFSLQVKEASDYVAKISGKINSWIMGERHVLKDYRSRGSELYRGEEILTREQLDDRQKAMEALRKSWPKILYEDSWSDMEAQLARQEQYLLGREMARDASQRYEEELAEIEKGLDKPWFGGEAGKRLVAEMEGLRDFFSGLGSYEQWDKAIGEYESIKGNDMFWGVLNKNQQEKMTKTYEAAKTNMRAFSNLSELLSRPDLPATLRAVIEAAQKGEGYDFGNGADAKLRGVVYKNILKSLGLELPPSLIKPKLAPEAAAPAPAAEPAVAPAPKREPEPAPAPVETAAEKRQRAEKEFLGDTQVPEVGNMSAGQKKMLEGVKSKQRGAAQAAQGLAQRADADPGQRENMVTVAKQMAGMVLREARGERNPKKRQELLKWAQEFNVALAGTSLAGEFGVQAFDALMGMIVAELSGK